MRVTVLCVSLMLLFLTACGQINGGTPRPGDQVLDSTPTGQSALLTEAAVVDRVWSSLELNTSSRDRANWEVDEIRLVVGHDMAGEFEGEPAPGCWKGPTPMPNSVILGSESYWFVRMRPKRATPVPQERTQSPTEPPAVPEPFLYQALFLLESDSGRIVARRLFCVIY